LPILKNMRRYRVTLKTDPLNPVILPDTYAFNDEELQGICIMTLALYGDNAPKVLEIEDKAARSVNCSRLVDLNKTILAEGEEIFEFGDEGDDIETLLKELNIYPTKRRLAIVRGFFGSYLVQFDTEEFLRGMETACSWFTNYCGGIDEFVLIF